ncbi:hypothetical protein TNCV_3182271 [Trichonephila clavipes]|uniref:Uncharacterized protein n=1 Tax=Trichonephila clavipes TaxID=2585209 RepID=A0A8X6SDV7_TRICX|nr:hypothetical protein TNCV_3182271 [Trichonephila clavipes]
MKGSKTVLRKSSAYRCDDDQRDPAIKSKCSHDHNSWFSACVASKSESKVGTLPWVSLDTSSMIVRTQLEAGFVAKHYMSPVSMIRT